MPRRKNDYLSDGGSDSDASLSDGSEASFNSQEDDDSRAERRLFEHKSRKRRRTGGRSGKEAAWEGIFGEDEGERRGGGRGLGARRSGRAGPSDRTDWTKAPSFVPTAKGSTIEAKADGDEATGEEEDEDEEDEVEEDSDSESDEEEEETTRPPSPRVKEDDYDDDPPPPRMGLGGGGGLGFAKATGMQPSPASQAEPATAKPGGRGGIGSSKRGGRGGIGSSSRAEQSEEVNGNERPSLSTSNSLTGGLGSAKDPIHGGEGLTDDSTVNSKTVPSAFGRRAPEESEAGPSDYNRSQQSAFRGRNDGPPPAASKKIELTAKEKAHFSKIDRTYGVAAKMLSNMGWSAGEGLGKDRSGRAVPVEVGKVMRGQGITSGMRTEDSKREARRKGEKFSDDEDEKPRHRRGKGKGGFGGLPRGVGAEAEEATDQSWKKQKKVKVKVEHKTYEQLLEEAGETSRQGVGMVIDARGGELKEVSNLASLSLSSWTPSSDATQLPELRHNLRLVVDVSKGDVDALAKEGKAVNEKRRWALREEQLARKRIEDTTRNIARLERLQELIEMIAKITASEAAKSEPSLDALDEPFRQLLDQSGSEYKALGMDEVIVGALAQVLRRVFAEWQPFDPSSSTLADSLKRWKRAYNLPNAEDDRTLTTNGHTSPRPRRTADGERVMTPWESLLWNVWLPKVRSVINNEWTPSRPHQAVQLLEQWDPILPPFIRDNILDQLILPKVRTAIDDWDARKSKSNGGKSRSLAGILFPWLPMLGGRMDEYLEIAKRRIRHVMRKWVVGDGVPAELEKWKKDIYSSKEWDELMLNSVVPKLGVCLRDDFTINPRKQDMVPLEEWVLPWHKLLRPSTFCQLLEVNFFPKFLDTLYIWLVQPNRNGDEIASWFLWWKGRFPEQVLEMKGVAHGFRSALQLMDEASKLGNDTTSKLQKPKFIPLPPSLKSSKSSSTSSKRSTTPGATAAKAGGAGAQVDTGTEITFRTLAEDYATQNDLVFVPLGRSHGSTGKPLFKVSKTVTGKGGVTIYVGENAVFAQGEDGTFRAVSLDDMVKRATGSAT